MKNDLVSCPHPHLRNIPSSQLEVLKYSEFSPFSHGKICKLAVKLEFFPGVFASQKCGGGEQSLSSGGCKQRAKHTAATAAVADRKLLLSFPGTLPGSDSSLLSLNLFTHSSEFRVKSFSHCEKLDTPARSKRRGTGFHSSPTAAGQKFSRSQSSSFPTFPLRFLAAAAI